MLEWVDHGVWTFTVIRTPVEKKTMVLFVSFSESVGVPVVTQQFKNLPSIHEDATWIPVLA